MKFITDQWQQRYAGLMAISTIGEGCEKQMEPLLGTLMESIILYLQDPVSIKVEK